MKRATHFFCIIIAVAAWMLGLQRAHACLDDGRSTYNQYVFRVAPFGCVYAYDSALRADLKAEWESYAHCSLTKDDMDSLAELTRKRVEKMSHPVLNYARKKGDQEMLTYLKYLADYLEGVQDYSYEWYYPDPDELLARRTNLSKLLAAVRAEKASPRLASRYLLLQMRVLFRIEDYDGCERLWQQCGQKTPDNVFDRMAYDFYAGALFRLGRRQEAAEAYAVLGDCVSARFCLYSNSSVACISSIARQNANSAVLPLLVEHFINSVQETHDFVMTRQHRWLGPDEEYVYGRQMLPFFTYVLTPNSYARYTEDYFPFVSEAAFREEVEEHDYPAGNPFIFEGTYPVYNQEVEDFLALSEEMLRRSDLHDAALWAAARAYIYYMRGQHEEAWQMIKDVRSLSASTPRIAENARIIRALIATSIADETLMETELLSVVKWLKDRMNSETNAAMDHKDNVQEHWSDSNFYNTVLKRIVVHGLAAHYDKDGKSQFVRMCYYFADVINMMNYYGEDYPDLCFYESGGVFADCFKALSYEEQKAFYEFSRNAQDLTPLQHYLWENLADLEYDLRDYIGTRCLLEGRWQEAIDWLEPIPLDYLNEQHIALYASVRKWTNEQWFHHVKVNPDEFYDDELCDYSVQLKRNAKVDFCRDVLRMQSELLLTTGEAHCQKAYELATVLFNASARGDCWWLARYGNAMNYMWATDDAYKDPSTAYDFVGEARRLTSEVLRTSDSKLKSCAMMARFYMQGEPPYDAEMDDTLDEYIYIFNSNRPSFRSFSNLYDLLKRGQPVDKRVSHCDVVLRCVKLYENDLGY